MGIYVLSERFPRLVIITVVLFILLYFPTWVPGSEVPVIKAIEVRGNKKIETSTILFYLQLHEGEPFSISKIREDIKTLYALGYFKDVKADVQEFEGGLLLTYLVEEKPAVSQIEISGNKAIKAEDIKEAMVLKVNAFTDQKVIQESLERIKSLYQSKGYYLAEVDFTLEERPENQMALFIHIKEGEKIRIKRITFEGNEHISSRRLKKILETKKKGLLPWITPSGIHKEDVLERDLIRIAGHYKNQGYLQVRVLDPKIEIDEAAKGIYITIPIKEGERYYVGNIEVQGDDIFTAEELHKMIDMKEGQVFDQSKFRQSIIKITDAYADKGYVSVEAIPKTDIDEATKRVDAKIDIYPGQVYYVGDITITGNTRTLDKVIRREMRLTEGDIFSSRKLNRSKQRIGNLGFFESADLNVEQGSEEDLLDIEIKVKEMPTGSITGGVGYSSNFGLMGTAGISQRNFLGTGRKVSVQGEVGGRSTDFVLSYYDPYLFDLPLNFGLDFYNRETEYRTYSFSSTGGQLLLGRYIGEHTRFLVAYRLELANIVDVTADASAIVQQEAARGETLTSSIKPWLTRDTRDNVLSPTTGWQQSLSFELAGGPLGGDNHFYRTKGETNWYHPFKFGTVFHVRAEAGYVDSFKEQELPLFERFYLGGYSSIRGFSFREVGPKDETGEAIGGNAMAAFNFELLFPVIETLKGVVFFDAGNVYDKNDIDGDLRMSVGFGIRLRTPVGPISVDYGIKIDRKPGETPARWHFNVGRFF